MVGNKAVSTTQTLPPPRLTGNSAQDLLSIQRWVDDLYDRLFKSSNILAQGAINDARLAALEASVAAIKAHFGL